MICPKCGNEQAGTKTCEACGLIFEKYQRYQELRGHEKIPASSASSGGKGGMTFWAVLGVCVFLGVGFWFLRTGKTPSQKVELQPAAKAVTAPQKDSQNTQNTSAEKFDGLDLVKQLETNAPPGNLIEKARNASVFLQTSWSQGAGFFIDEKCTIVTNRHVVRMSDEIVSNAENVLQKARQQVQRLEAKIQHNRKVYKMLLSGEAHISDPNISMGDLKRDLEQDEKALDDAKKEIDAKEMEFDEEKANSDVTIVLADGSKLDGLVDYVSDDQDLALVRPLGKARCPSIPFGDPGNLNQGDPLYTIGSPMGIRHVVTSGVFSGSTNVNGRLMLQTDAPINPGNSGGPLINKQGQVVGINTLLLRNAQGIGFAIPIGQAMEQLKSMW